MGIDITMKHPTHVNNYLDRDFDYVIPAWDNAKESGQFIRENVKSQLHFGFNDQVDFFGNALDNICGDDGNQPVTQAVMDSPVFSFNELNQ